MTGLSKAYIHVVRKTNMVVKDWSSYSTLHAGSYAGLEEILTDFNNAENDDCCGMI